MVQADKYNKVREGAMTGRFEVRSLFQDKVETMIPSLQVKAQVILEREHFQRLLDVLHNKEYQVVGPTVRDNAIVYETLTAVADLPIGYTDEQDGGRYRLKKRADDALFGYAVGPHSWKKFLHPPVIRLWQGRRGNICIIALNCGQAGGTCFCTSMQTGPKADAGFDLALTEVLEEGRHYFVIEVGTELGAEIVHALPYREASEHDIQVAEHIVANTAAHMGRSMDTTGIKDLLYRNLEHPRWNDVATRCLTCGNCTMVCPTCFCTTVEDVTDLSGEQAERWRKWDSCYTMDFSYIYGGSIRSSTKARYRQWMTHKLASWI